jgi:hypothetical protein
MAKLHQVISSAQLLHDRILQKAEEFSIAPQGSHDTHTEQGHTDKSIVSDTSFETFVRQHREQALLQQSNALLKHKNDKYWDSIRAENTIITEKAMQKATLLRTPMATQKLTPKKMKSHSRKVAFVDSIRVKRKTMENTNRLRKRIQPRGSSKVCAHKKYSNKRTAAHSPKSLVKRRALRGGSSSPASSGEEIGLFNSSSAGDKNSPVNIFLRKNKTRGKNITTVHQDILGWKSKGETTHRKTLSGPQKIYGDKFSPVNIYLRKFGIPKKQPLDKVNGPQDDVPDLPINQSGILPEQIEDVSHSTTIPSDSESKKSPASSLDANAIPLSMPCTTENTGRTPMSSSFTYESRSGIEQIHQQVQVHNVSSFTESCTATTSTSMPFLYQVRKVSLKDPFLS